VTTADLQDQIAAARAYEALHVPALFGQWCGPVLDAAGAEPGQRVLDVASGTGVLGRAAAARVGPTGFVAGLDPDPGMLTVARQLAPAVEWDQLENTGAYPLEVGLLERIGGQRAADALRAPFVLGDIADLRGLFERAGATSIGITTRNGTARFPGVRAMIEADLRGWLPVMGVMLEEDRISRILEQAETALREYVAADGRVEFDLPAHIVTATKP
jgi:SAM-dependent methyltransferase